MFLSADNGDSLLLRKEAHLDATRCRVTGDGMAFVKTPPYFPSASGGAREGRGGGDGTRVKQDIISLMSSPGPCSFIRSGSASSQHLLQRRNENG